MRAQTLQSLREAGGWVSGEILASRLGISRVGVWKHVRALREDGYVIGASGSGYRLVSSPDLLLPAEFPRLEGRMRHFRALGSTMDVARDLARRQAEDGTIVVAEVQAGGRGRLGREWVSPQGGVYFTLITRPGIGPADAPRMTLGASVGVANAVWGLYGVRAELKWPNDVLVRGRKLCGILAEMEAEPDAVRFVNLGVGINANNRSEGVEGKAVSLREVLGRPVSRRDLFESVVSEIVRELAAVREGGVLEEWRSLSATLGKEVRVLAPGGEVRGLAVDIDSVGALLVKQADGSLSRVFAGDCVHVR